MKNGWQGVFWKQHGMGQEVLNSLSRCSRAETFSFLNCVFPSPLPVTNIA